LEIPIYDKAESLADFLLRSDHNMKKFYRVLRSAMRMLLKDVYYKDVTSAPEGAIEKFYLTRTERRVKVLRENDAFLKKMTEEEHLVINGKKYLNILPLIKAIREDRALYESLKPTFLSLSPHGDLLINNFLLLDPDDPNNDDYIICDVRGEGTKQWEPIYDLAKMKHSFEGHNFIRRNLFKLKVDREKISFDLKFDQSHPAWGKYYVSNLQFADFLESLPEFDRMKKLSPNWKNQLLFAEAIHFVADSACRCVDYKERDQAITAYLLGVMLLNNFVRDAQGRHDLPADSEAGEWQIADVMLPEDLPKSTFEFSSEAFDLIMCYYKEGMKEEELIRSLKTISGICHVEMKNDELTVTGEKEVVKFHLKEIEINERHGLKDRIYVKIPNKENRTLTVEIYSRDIRDDFASGKRGNVYVLGVGRNSHDSSAVLLKDGRIVGAIAEERLNQNKHSRAYFPVEATKYLLEANGITWEDIDHIAVMWDNNMYRDTPHSRAPYRDFISEIGIPSREKDLHGKYDTNRFQRFLEKMAIDSGTGHIPAVTYVRHHKAHATGAWHSSGFPEPTLVVVLDGRGETEATSIWLAENGQLKKISSTQFVHSMGMFYETLTAHLGFNRYDEGKVMGFAPYGAPRSRSEQNTVNGLRELMKELFWFDPSVGEIRMKQEYFNYASFNTHEDLAFSKLFREKLERFVPPLPKGRGGSKLRPEDRAYAHLAFVAQERSEEVVMEMISYYLNKFPRTKGVKHVVLSGGFSLNIATNGKLVENGIVDADKIFIPSSPADDGAPMGAALSVCSEEYGINVAHSLESVSLGKTYSDENIRSILEASGLKEGVDYFYLENNDKVVSTVADAVMDSKVVGWFQGGSEFGPRALGNRSILNRLDDPKGNEKVNQIKGREPWRPSALSIQLEKAPEFLDGVNNAPFMTIGFPVKKDKSDKITAGVHPSDGTTRPQTVSKEQNPLYWALLGEIGRRSGVPGILNTSFNRAGPIVETPLDALNTFFYAKGLDLLVMGHFMVKSRDHIVPSLLNGRDENSLNDLLKKALSDGKPLSQHWDRFWEKATELSASREAKNQDQLIVYVDDMGDPREVLRVPLIKEIFQSGVGALLIHDLAARIQKSFVSTGKATVSLETTMGRYDDIIVGLFEQYAPKEILDKWNIVKLGCASSSTAEKIPVPELDTKSAIHQISDFIQSERKSDKISPAMIGLYGGFERDRKTVIEGLAGDFHVIAPQRWNLPEDEINNELKYPFSNIDFNGFTNAILRLKSGKTALVPLSGTVSVECPDEGFIALGDEEKQKLEKNLIKKNSKVWLRSDGHLFEQITPEVSDVFIIDLPFTLESPLLRSVFDKEYRVVAAISSDITVQLNRGDYETLIDFESLNTYLGSLSYEEAVNLFNRLDGFIKDKELAKADVQVRYMFFKLLTMGKDNFLNSSTALKPQVKDKIIEITGENGWKFAYVSLAVYHSMVEDGTINNLSRKRLLNAPKILFVAPIRPSSADDRFGHYIGARYFRFQQTSQMMAANYLDLFGLEAEV
ncbi:MAG: carbamoyltransferase C-terminal domain-containing protein, partial [Candidatus Omnitrophica bacterium]|nr:carbamoyltransferase C-terminal domain-containing protein [Candidatus Omnitrophota bacterium]